MGSVDESAPSIEPLHPYGLWIVAGFMVMAGLLCEVAMMLPLVMQESGKHLVSGWPLALLVGGLLLPLAAKGRKRLVVSMEEGRFKWDPPLVVDRASKRQVAATMEKIVEACKAVDVRVADSGTS